MFSLGGWRAPEEDHLEEVNVFITHHTSLLQIPKA